MVRFSNPAWAFAALPLLFVGECLTAGAAGMSGLPIEVRFESSREIPLGTPILVYAVLTNVGTEALVVDLGPFREAAFSFRAQSTTGKLRAGEWTIREGVAEVRTVLIEPSSTYKQQLIVDRWLTLNEIGEYGLDVSLEAKVFRGGRPPVFYNGEEVGILTANDTLPLLVKDDPESAERVCAELANRAKVQDASVSLSALDALTFVSTSACLPALKGVVLEGKHTPYIALEGIVRVGGAAALEVLLELLPESVGEVRYEVVRHLRYFCEEFPDEVSETLLKEGEEGCKDARD